MKETLTHLIELAPEDPVWVRFALVVIVEIGYIATMLFS